MRFLVGRLTAVLVACLVAAFPAAAQTVVTLYNQYSAPQYVAVDANKTVFVTDTTNSLSALGFANGAYATTPIAYDTNFATLYVSPNGVAVGPDGHILSVSMSSSVPGFFFLFEFGPPNYAEIVDGSLPITSGTVQGVAADSQGNFFVGATNGTVIKIFAPDYQSATSITTGVAGTDHAYGIAFDSHDNLFVADQQSGSGRILEYATAGGIVLLNTITGGNLQAPTGVAVDTLGNLYVADSAANTLTEFAAPDYATTQVIVSTGLSGPMGVAVDADDNIFIVDTGNNALKEVLALPAVAALDAPAGPVAGGNLVTITGRHLSGASAVTFGGTAATGFTVVSDTEVTATAPAGSVGTVDIRVTTPNGTSIAAPAARYTYTAVPTVASLFPVSGPTAGGTLVAITGTNFTSDSTVAFGGTPATNVSLVGNRLFCNTPPGTAGTVDVTVTTPGGTSATTTADHYTYFDPPVVISVSPSAGPTAGGNTVTIRGAHLTGTTEIDFRAYAATSFTVISDTEATATVPPEALGTVDVTVNTPGGQSATSPVDQYSFVAGPVVTGVSPSVGPASGGTVVTITGSDLLGATAVTFGGTAAGFTVNSATQITATAPPAAAGTVDIVITAPGGTSTTGVADHYTYAAGPVVTALSPSVGPTAGGTLVTITGAALTGATAVHFGGTAATAFTVVSATQITATAPAEAAGTVDVTVTTPLGTSATGAADAFTFEAAPTVTGISPAGGPIAGGNAVTITGTGFAGATSVKFGAAAAHFSIDSAGQITATAPAGSTGTVDIVVTTPNGTSPTGSADRYSYTALPVVGGISPSSGGIAGGTAVTISGSNLAGAAEVLFGTIPATRVTGNAAGQLVAISPPGAAGPVDVVVATGQGISAVTAADRFTYTSGTAGQVYTYQSTLGVTGTAKPDNSHFNGPSAGAVDAANGHLLVADTGNDRVQVLDTGTLAVVATIGTPAAPGSDAAHLNAPQGVEFDPATGHILVADTGNDRIQVFDAKSFAYVTTLGGAGQLASPASIRLNPALRQLYVADTADNRVQVFDADSLALISTIGTGIAGSGNTQLNQPRDAVLDPATNQILVADSANSRIQLFDAATLAYVRTIGGPTLGAGDNDYLGTPGSIAFDPASDLVLVADSGTDDRVQVFDALSYDYVLTLGTTGSSGSGNGQFAGPGGIAADPAHRRLFVGDRRNDRVQVFSIGAQALFAAVLPGSRTVELGNPATIFASLINAGTTPLTGCRPALAATAPAGLSLGYQTTNPATNALTGTPDTPVSIAGGNGVQSFLLSFHGTAPTNAGGLNIDFDCAGAAPAAVQTGVDTVDLILSSGPVADIIALAATPTNNGIVDVPTGGIGAFAVASTNAGAASLIVASVDTGTANLPVNATICQSNPATGQCLAPPAAAVTLSIPAGAAPTFSIFLEATAPIALDPAASRIFVRFKDAAGGLHGSTSVAIQAG